MESEQHPIIGVQEDEECLSGRDNGASNAPALGHGDNGDAEYAEADEVFRGFE